jgi:hypothetical protein
MREQDSILNIRLCGQYARAVGYGSFLLTIDRLALEKGNDIDVKEVRSQRV